MHGLTLVAKQQQQVNQMISGRQRSVILQHLLLVPVIFGEMPHLVNKKVNIYYNRLYTFIALHWVLHTTSYCTKWSAVIVLLHLTYQVCVCVMSFQRTKKTIDWNFFWFSRISPISKNRSDTVQYENLPCNMTINKKKANSMVLLYCIRL
jgi:hypothetical protein